LGEGWLLETGLRAPVRADEGRPRPGDRPPRLLGGARASLSAGAGGAHAGVVLAWIQTGLANRREAMRSAMRFGRGIDVKTADRFVEMYVNELTCDYGDEGRKAVAELLGRGDAIAAFPEP